MAAVSNSGPIISFARANRLDLLHEVVGELIIPDAVYEDIVIEGARKPGVIELPKLSWIKRVSVKDRTLVEQFPRKLHLGEREAIALAKELNAALMVDEREARKEALRLGIEHFGSLKVLQEAKERGIVKKIKPVLDELIAAGMYISKDLYHEFLRKANE